MHLYSLTLQQATAIQKAIYGNFSGPKAQEIIVSRGKYLELLRPDENSGKMQVIHSQEVFGIVRNICAFRLTGASRDYIIMTSDSGRVVILQFDPEKNCFQKIHQETYGKTGCRRIVPGQYLAVDPKGRAFMVAAVEKQKFVYILNRDSQAKLTISSPLEAHKSHTLIFDICGIDVGYENPLFACIESDYGEPDAKDSATCTGIMKKSLTFYEMDLGLNHVVRKNMEEIHLSAHMLIPIPGNPDGPGGLIICCEGYLVYKGINAGKELKVPFPRRIGAPTDRNLIVNCFAAHKQKELFFFLIQTEIGDLLKLSFQFTQEEVHNVQLQYFDSVPSAISLCILKSGYLFSACEFGNHQLYKFISIGDNEKLPILTDSTMSVEDIVEFPPRILNNLSLMDELENLSAISDMKIEDLTGEGNPQIYTLCSAGDRSSLRILRHGLAVTELAVSPLPGKPLGIWTIKENVNDELHKYIVLTFSSQTLVLSIGEKVIEVSDSGLDLSKPTLHVALMEDKARIQVNPNGIRHIRKDKIINQWMTEGKITKAASNPRQLVIAIAGGEIIYFEIDNLGNLTEVEKMTLESEVVCLDIGNIPEGRQRCKFLALGLSDNTVRMFSLEVESCLHRLSTQALPSQPESVCLLEMKGDRSSIEEESTPQLFLHVGLSNGLLLRTAVDSVTGNLTDTRNRFLGSRPVKCFKILIHNEPSMLALSSRSWICYNYLSRYYVVPLSYDPFDYAAGFHSTVCAEGIVGISSNSLKIITPERLGELFNQTILPLRYIPRKMTIHPESHNIIIIESSNRSFCEREKNELKKQLYQGNEEAINLPETQVGALRAPPGCWASCVRVVEPISCKTLDLMELENNESATSLNLLSFVGHEGELILIIGTVKDLIFQPKSFSACYLYAYSFVENGTRLQLLHKTPIEDIPYCMTAFKGKLLVGVGNKLRLYDLGMKKMLKKAELKGFSTGINTIQTHGERIFVSDLADSFHVLKFRPKMQTFYEFADDILPRWITSACVLDHRTIIGGDKFENVFVCRLPSNVEDEVDEDLATYKFKWETGYLNGAAHKMDQICSFYTGELITNINKTSLVNNSNEVIIYGTSMGGICALYPFETKEDVDFFIHLEMYLRIEWSPLCGRDHIMFRSYYSPIKNVIDGDLCEQFSRMTFNKQKVLSDELDRTPAEVLKKLEDIRNRIL